MKPSRRIRSFLYSASIAYVLIATLLVYYVARDVVTSTVRDHEDGVNNKDDSLTETLSYKLEMRINKRSNGDGEAPKDDLQGHDEPLVDEEEETINEESVDETGLEQAQKDEKEEFNAPDEVDEIINEEDDNVDQVDHDPGVDETNVPRNLEVEKPPSPPEVREESRNERIQKGQRENTFNHPTLEFPTKTPKLFIKPPYKFVYVLRQHMCGKE